MKNMNAKDVRTVDQIEQYIEGCLNDFEGGISDKTETTAALIKLCIQILEITREKLTNTDQDHERPKTI